MTAGRLAALITGDDRAWAGLAREEPAAIVGSARAHGLLPLVAEAVTRRDKVPVSALGLAFRDEARRLLALDLVREHELRLVVGALAGADVRALLMKGADLAYSRYERPDLRPRLDTDLLVHPSRREAARATLESLDYEAVPQTGGDLLMYQMPFRKLREGRAVHIVDLHWRIANPQHFARVLEFDELFTRSEPRPALGPAARGLGIVHALLLACVHRIAHHFDSPRLIWSYDVHLLASALGPEQWRTFADLARQRAMAAVCRRSLTIAAEAFGTAVPADVMAALESGADQERGNEPFLAPRTRHAERILSDLRHVHGWTNRYRLARQHVFPPRHYMRDVYAPSSTAPLWVLYARRILRGSRKWLVRP